MFEGKKVLITGGGRGIGKAVAEAFAKDGAKLLLVARTMEELKETQIKFALRYHSEAVISSTDVSSHAEVEALVDIAEKVFERELDILVNAAGIHGVIGFLSDVDVREWERAIKINLFGTFYMIKEFLPFIGKPGRSGRGKIINFSGGGATSPRPYFSAYAASKTAVVRFTETAAEEFRLRGIPVDINAVSPGAIKTRLFDEALAYGEKTAVINSKQALEKAVQLCLFLASPKSDGLSGKLISAVWDDWKNIPGHINEIMKSEIYTLRRIGGRKWINSI